MNLSMLYYIQVDNCLSTSCMSHLSHTGEIYCIHHWATTAYVCCTRKFRLA